MSTPGIRDRSEPTDTAAVPDSPVLPVLTVLFGVAAVVLLVGGVLGVLIAPDVDFTGTQLFWRIAPAVACVGGFVYCVLRGRR